MFIKLFGTTAVVTADQDASRPTTLTGVKPRQLLEILAVQAGESIPKDRLAELLWDGQPPAAYVASLESYICVLRRELGCQGRGSALATTPGGYRLDPDRIQVDVVEFRRFVRRAETAAPAVRVRLMNEALSLLTGELLASESYTPWAQDERSAFGRELAAACQQAAAAAITIGDHDSALRFADRALVVEPLQEAAWVSRIEALAGSGRRADALRAYGDLRAATLEQIGIEPGRAAQEAYLRVLADDRQPQQGSSARGEVAALLMLLRQALEALPGVAVPHEDKALSAVAVDLLQAA